MQGSPTTRPTFRRSGFFSLIGYAPHPGQILVHASAASRRIVACGVRWGKSRAAAMDGLASAMEPRRISMGWVVAPTYDLAEKVFREIVQVAHEKLKHRVLAYKESEHLLKLRNLHPEGVSEIRSKSADNPVSLLGEGLDWVIIDEAARIKPAIWEGHLTQRLIDRNGRALLISTPKGKGWFWDLFRRGQSGDPSYSSWNAPSWQNPHLPPELIEAERSRLPERVFKQEYGGEFLEGAGQVFRNVRERCKGGWQDPVPRMRYHAGLDLAKVEDFTVLTIVNKDCRVVFSDRFHRLDWSLQVARIKEHLERYGMPTVFVDTTGAGEPIFESLKQAGIRCEPYPFSAKSKDALVNNLALLFEKKTISLPDALTWPDGIDELEAFEYSITEQGNVKTGAAPGYHDDIVISLALAVWPFARKKEETDWKKVEKALGDPMKLAQGRSPTAKYRFPTW